MTLKQYTTTKLVVVVLLAMIIAQSVILKNYFLPLIALALAITVLFYIKGRVKEVIADERDYETGGKAARWAIQVFGWFGSAIMIVLYTQKDINPSYEPIAATLAYSLCFLMIVYSLLFKYYDKIIAIKHKAAYIAFGIVIILVLMVIGARMLSGEDTWLCSKGEWVRHGQPSFPAPTVPCK